MISARFHNLIGVPDPLPVILFSVVACAGMSRRPRRIPLVAAFACCCAAATRQLYFLQVRGTPHSADKLILLLKRFSFRSFDRDYDAKILGQLTRYRHRRPLDGSRDFYLSAFELPENGYGARVLSLNSDFTTDFVLIKSVIA